MSFPIDEARQQGYSDDEILDFLSKKDKSVFSKISQAKDEGYDSKEILEFFSEKEKPSKAASVASAYAEGLLEGASDLAESFPGSRGPIPKEIGLKALRQLFPSRNEEIEKYAKRAGKLTPVAALGPGGRLLKGLQLATGTLAGQLAEEEGAGPVGEAVAEAVGMGAPSLIKGASKGVGNLFKGPQEKLKSGLTQPKAMQAAFSKFAKISPERQKNRIESLNKEASQLTKKTIEKHLPLSKKLQEGFDFQSHFKNSFKDLQTAAEKANPTIDISPIVSFLDETRKKYKGIPSLHSQAQKIIKETRNFRNNPPLSLKNLLKVYRSNNQKKADIYERAMVKGKQKEYVDFLNQMNRKIIDAFEKTLPEDSAWLQKFKDLNKEFGAVESSKKTLQNLRTVLKGTVTSNQLEKLADDPVLKKKLSISMGKEGTEEISQIAKDLKEARQSLKRIPKTKLKTIDEIIPLGLLFPGLKIPATAYKLTDFARRSYGWLLSTPKRRSLYRDLLKSIQAENIPSAVKTAQSLKKSFDEDEL